MTARGDFKPLRPRLEKSSIPEPNSGCLLWTGAVMPGGYGKIRYQCVTISAHRAAWIDERGPIPPGLDALHKCDNPPCINVDHLFLGSPADNSADMARKMRTTTRLTREAVLAIFRDPRPHLVVGAEHGIARTTVSDIKNGHSFGWLTMSGEEPSHG